MELFLSTISYYIGYKVSENMLLDWHWNRTIDLLTRAVSPFRQKYFTIP